MADKINNRYEINVDVHIDSFIHKEEKYIVYAKNKDEAKILLGNRLIKLKEMGLIYFSDFFINDCYIKS